jgi:hypothetical protein
MIDACAFNVCVPETFEIEKNFFSEPNLSPAFQSFSTRRNVRNISTN